jgi:hypothetical protein
VSEYHVSFYDFETGREVAADGPVTMGLDEILALMDEVLTSAGSFVSVKGEGEGMLQFIAEDDRMLSLELPAPPKRGSYAKRVTLEQGKALLRGLGGKVQREDFDGLVFARW